jgi:3-phenylpropionate/trans-cinnamate dioxygenase ferredoxin reductase subunit
MTDHPHVVVIGAGHGGVQLAASLRQLGHRAPITLLADEHELPYQRPPLSKSVHVPGGQPALPLRAERFYLSNDIVLATGSAATAIDTAARRVELADGTPLGYDELVLATGARARTLPQIPPDLGGVCYLRSLRDSHSLWSQLESARDVVVVGGGFLGLEFAAVARSSGASVTVLEAAARLMGRAVSTPVSELFRRVHTEAGIDIMLAESLAEVIESGGRVTAVRTSSGAVLRADLLLISVGAVPNTELAAEAGLRVADGILVDRSLAASAPGVSAIGDSARWPYGQESVRLESVQNAVDQARCVAARLTGDRQEYQSVPWFWSDQGSVKLQIAGLGSEQDNVVVRGDAHSNAVSVFRYTDGRLTCVESVNRPSEHLAARRLLEAGRDLDPALAADPDIDLKALAREAAARRNATCVPPADLRRLRPANTEPPTSPADFVPKGLSR